MKRHLDLAVRDDTSGSNFSQIKRFVEYIKYDLDHYPQAVAIIIHRFTASSPDSQIHCLNLLDQCMEDLGHAFISLVNRNDVLNPLIRRVHPKYDEWNTPAVVQKKIIQMIDKWGKKYGTYSKIANVRQRVLACSRLKPIADEKGMLGDELANYQLKALLSNPTQDNIQAANLIIKSMVKKKDDDVQKSLKYLDHLSLVEEHCSILDQMLRNNATFSSDDLQTLKDVAAQCDDHLNKLQVECEEAVTRDDPMLDKLLKTADHIIESLKKYKILIGESTETITEPVQPSIDEPLILFEIADSENNNTTVESSKNAQNSGGDLFQGLDLFDFSAPTQFQNTESAIQKTHEAPNYQSNNLFDFSAPTQLQNFDNPIQKTNETPINQSKNLFDDFFK